MRSSWFIAMPAGCISQAEVRLLLLLPSPQILLPDGWRTMVPSEILRLHSTPSSRLVEQAKGIASPTKTGSPKILPSQVRREAALNGLSVGLGFRAQVRQFPCHRERALGVDAARLLPFSEPGEVYEKPT